MHFDSTIRLPWRTNIAFLLVTCVAYAAASLVAQIEFPSWGNSAFSPLELAIWLAIFASIMGTISRLSASDPSGYQRRYWTLATIGIIAITVLESADWFADTRHIWQTAGYDSLSYFLKAALAIIIAAGLFWSTQMPREYRWGVRCLQAIVIFQFLSIVFETTQSGRIFGYSFSVPEFTFSTEFAELLCIELYIVSLALSKSNVAPDAFLRTDLKSGTLVGANARRVYGECNLYYGARHPPVAIAFYPVFQEAALLLVASWLGFTAGRAVKHATGKAVYRQILEMTSLWFNNGIDPPSYYALELFEQDRQRDAANYLTRFETKNGLLHALNNRSPNPFPKSEMRDKALFAKCCRDYGIPFPETLATASDGHLNLSCAPADLARDLFCKRQRGMGAIGTLAFRYQAPGTYISEDGHSLDWEGVSDEIRKASLEHPMLLQPWLGNHPSVADMAIDSLITIRVITCQNELGCPEVNLAMLRLLAKLEPQWKELPDEEYAAPIDLGTGELGQITGDNLQTSHLRYDNHPATGKPVRGRILSEWPAIRELALTAHKAFPHRLVVGWDIALTESGPVVLEGNTNFDVMFLQRVHNAPIGRSRLGELMNFHMQDLRRERLGSLPNRNLGLASTD